MGASLEEMADKSGAGAEEEVRKLAEESDGAAKKIADLASLSVGLRKLVGFFRLEKNEGGRGLIPVEERWKKPPASRSDARVRSADVREGCARSGSVRRHERAERVPRHRSDPGLGYRREARRDPHSDARRFGETRRGDSGDRGNFPHRGESTSLYFRRRHAGNSSHFMIG